MNEKFLKKLEIISFESEIKYDFYLCFNFDIFILILILFFFFCKLNCDVWL